MAQAMLDHAHFCCQCFQYFETKENFEQHNYNKHQPKFGNGVTIAKIQICFQCSEQLSKVVQLHPVGSSIFLLKLCPTCTAKNGFSIKT